MVEVFEVRIGHAEALGVVAGEAEEGGIEICSIDLGSHGMVDPVRQKDTYITNYD